MSFVEELNIVFEKSDFDKALSLLHSIFADPSNQEPKKKPTDFLNSENDKKLLGMQYEFAVSQFKFNIDMDEQFDFIIDMLNSSRDEKSDIYNFFQPFNALVFDIGYSTVITSYHYDSGTNTLMRQYGLNHDALGEYQEDSFYDGEALENVRNFKFDIENGKYAISRGNEIIDGRMLSDVIDRVLISRFLRTVFIPSLILNEGFAIFPKDLPFYFFLTTKHGTQYDKIISDGSFIEIHPPLTSDFVENSTLTDIYKKSLEHGSAVYPEDHLCYYINFLHKDRRHLPELSKLFEIIIADKAAFEVIKHISEIFLTGHIHLDDEYMNSGLFRKVQSAFRWSSLSDFVIIFRALGEMNIEHVSLAVDFAERFLRKTSPVLDTNPDNAVQQAEQYIKEVAAVYALLSSEQQKSVYGAYDAKINELISHSSAIYRTLAYEAEIRRLNELTLPGESASDKEIVEINQKKYAESVCDLLLLMPDEFQMYRPHWYFIMPRVKQLGAGEPSVIPRLLSLFEKYSIKGGCDRDRVSAIIGTMLINAGIVDVPPSIETVFHEIMSEEKEYREWKVRIPKEKFEEFILLFESDAGALRDPTVWENFIHDSLGAVGFFRDQIYLHPQKDVLFEILFQAAEKGPGPRLVKLITKIVDSYVEMTRDEKPFYETAQRIIDCLAFLPDPSVKRIVQAQLVIAAHKIINGENDAADYLSSFAHQWKEFPMAAIFETVHEIHESGIDNAVRLFVDRWKEICNSDSQYARDFFFLSETDLEIPEKINFPRAYMIFSRAYKEYTQWSAFRAHKYIDRNSILLEDPVKKIIPELLSDLEKNEDAEIVSSLINEYEIRKNLEQTSKESLHSIIDSCSEETSRVIIEHFQHAADVFSDEYMALLNHFKSDITKYNNTLMKLWPIPQIRERLLDSLVDHPRLSGLPDFIYCYIGGSDYRITSEIVKHFQSRGFYDSVISIAGGLSVHRLIPFIEPVVRSFISAKQFTKAIDWFTNLRNDIEPNHPDYVFITNRIAVFQILNGDNVGAEKTYAELFSIDWSAFTGVRSEMDELSDDIMQEVMGGSLDSELIDQFNSSFASAHYNMACLMGKKGNVLKAVEELALAVKYNPEGYPSSMINSDNDFESIRSSDLFCDFIKNINIPN